MGTPRRVHDTGTWKLRVVTTKPDILLANQIGERRLLAAEFLGIVNGRNTGSTGRPLAFLGPSHLNAGTEWKALRQPLHEEFPSRGQLIWFDPPSEAVEGTLWRFQASENPKSDALDRFIVKDGSARQVFEIVDLRFVGDEDQIRQAISTTGLEATAPSGNRSLLWVTDRLLIGPVVLWSSQGAQKIQIPLEELIEPLSVWQPLIPQSITLADGRRLLVPPPDEKLIPRGQRDWSDDSTVLRRALRRVRRVAPDYVEALNLSEKVVDEMVRRLGVSETASDEVELDRYRLARAATILERARLTDEIAQALAERVGALDQVRTMVEQEASSLREILLSQAKEDAASIRIAAEDDAAGIRSAAAEYDVEMRKHIEELRTDAENARTSTISQLEVRIAELQHVHDSLTDEIGRLVQDRSARETELAADLAALDAELESRLQAILAKPIQVLSDIAILRAVWNFPEASGRKQHVLSVSEAADRSNEAVIESFWMLPAQSWHVQSDGDLQSALESIRSALGELGHPEELSAIGLAALLARSAPIVTGIGGREVLQVLGDFLTGGRVLTIPVSPGYLEPADLFGTWDPHSRSIHPDKHGLLDLMLAAPQIEGLLLVILEGINLAPIEAYLLPLLEAYRGSLLHGRTRRIAIAHPAGIRSEDRYAGASQLLWPDNVLLACTVVDGPATLPVPPDVWGFGTFLPAPCEGESQKRVAKRKEFLGVSIANSSWQSQSSRAAREDANAWDEFVENASAHGIVVPRMLIHCWRQVYQALLSLLDDEDEALDAAVASCVVPWVAATNELESLSTAGIDLGDLAVRLLEAWKRRGHPLHSTL